MLMQQKLYFMGMYSSILFLILQNLLNINNIL